MIITTLGFIPNQGIKNVLNIVTGNQAAVNIENAIRNNKLHIKDVIKNAREKAIDSLTQDAKDMGADAIIGVTTQVNNISGSVVEILYTGTAVTLNK